MLKKKKNYKIETIKYNTKIQMYVNSKKKKKNNKERERERERERET